MNMFLKVIYANLIFLCVNAVSAAQLTLTPIDADYYLHRSSGNGAIDTYTQAGSDQNGVDAYLVGAKHLALPTFMGLREELRNYFLFDLSAVSTQVTSATLRIFSNFDTYECGHREDIGCGYASDDSAEIFSLVDVQSPDILMSPAPGAEQSIFNDLGQGKAYGEISLTRDDVDVWLEIHLSSEALEDINQAAGLWAIGGYLSTLDAPLPGVNKEERLFIDHRLGVVPHPQLVLTAVPIPAVGWLFGSGLIGLCAFLLAFARRRADM